MAKKKNIEETEQLNTEKCKKTAKKSIKKDEPAPKQVQEVPEAVYIYHTGDNIQTIAKLLTGHAWLMFRMLEYSGLSLDSLKDGDIIRWRV